MKNPFPIIGQLFSEVWAAIIRFPLANASAIISFTLASLLIDDKEADNYPFINGLIVSSLGICFFISVQLLQETQGIRLRRGVFIKAFGLLLAIGYYFYLPEKFPLSYVYQIGLFACIFHLSISFIPFLNRKLTQYFWQFNQVVFLRILQSGFYSAVLFGGISLALLAIEHLFDFDINGKNYLRLYLFLGFVFNTAFFTAGIPKSFDAPIFYPKALKVFSQFVLIPLVSIYQLILYAYLGKIVITGIWPSGWVSHLVIFCTGFGILIVLLIWPLLNQKEESWIKWYARATFLSIFPLAILMGLSVYKRIVEYSFTEERLILVFLTFWLIFISIYFVVSRLKNIKAIPVSLAFFLLIANVGPWSVGELSRKAQFSELKSILVKNGLIKNGNWQKPKKPVSKIDRFQIGQKTEYLIAHFGTQSLLDLVDNPAYLNGRKKNENPLAQDVMDSLGLEYVSDYEIKTPKDKEEKYLTIQFPEKGSTTAFHVTGMDYCIPINLTAERRDSSAEKILFKGIVALKDQNLKLELDQSKIKINLNGERLELDLSQLSDSIFSKYSIGKSDFIQSQTSCKPLRVNTKSMHFKLLVLEMRLFKSADSLEVKELYGILILDFKANRL